MLFLIFISIIIGKNLENYFKKIIENSIKANINLKLKTIYKIIIINSTINLELIFTEFR